MVEWFWYDHTHPDLVRAEINRRIKAIQDANPTKKRKEAIEKELLRIEKSIKKLLDAYQEDFLHLEELRDRMPQLRKREKALQAELLGLEGVMADQQAVFRLANNLESFLRQLRNAADIERLTTELSLKDKTTIANMAETELSTLHLNLGEYIRNEFGLWSGNHELIKSCSFILKRDTVHEDEASSIIIRELWKRLRETHKLRVIK